ncbi:flagellar export chaperone FliS [Gorillibacterium timonense]|uniref:flagellar export chaperone FliS n=1 Tax=Gorillibacterium timonense TaxID=1689269 RepID=UPI00071D1098|nr:flagellar export chaperone FliS [Gorillibacterium timonense]
MIQYQQQQNRYLETTIATATPAQLLIMLCDGAIRFTRLALEAMKNNQPQEANRQFQRVQNIVSEFIITVDREALISKNLLQLYDYFNRRLIEANVSKDPAPAEEVLGYLIELKETWMQAAKAATAGKVTHE